MLTALSPRFGFTQATFIRQGGAGAASGARTEILLKNIQHLANQNPGALFLKQYAPGQGDLILFSSPDNKLKQPLNSILSQFGNNLVTVNANRQAMQRHQINQVV